MGENPVKENECGRIEKTPRVLTEQFNNNLPKHKYVHNGRRRIFLEDYSDEDSPTDRQMYRKTNMMKESMFHQHGIDNPTLEKDMAPVQTQKTESKA